MDARQPYAAHHRGGGSQAQQRQQAALHLQRPQVGGGAAEGHPPIPRAVVYACARGQLLQPQGGLVGACNGLRREEPCLARQGGIHCIRHLINAALPCSYTCTPLLWVQAPHPCPPVPPASPEESTTKSSPLSISRKPRVSAQKAAPGTGGRGESAVRLGRAHRGRSAAGPTNLLVKLPKLPVCRRPSLRPVHS